MGVARLRGPGSTGSARFLIRSFTVVHSCPYFFKIPTVMSLAWSTVDTYGPWTRELEQSIPWTAISASTSELRTYEVPWLLRSSALEILGYILRPRYHIGWIPSWWRKIYSLPAEDHVPLAVSFPFDPALIHNVAYTYCLLSTLLTSWTPHASRTAHRCS